MCVSVIKLNSNIKMKLFLLLSIFVTFISFVKLDDDNDDESLQDNLNNDVWDGKWFPNKPGAIDTTYGGSSDTNASPISDDHDRIQMGIPNDLCDTGNFNLELDFDPQSDVYLCLENRTQFIADYNTHPYVKVYEMPPQYVAIHKCMNETIEYDDTIPTFGSHRPLWPRFGEYMYVPPQRWLHNLEHGAIVALFHPCANQAQIAKLRTLVKNCLRRHIITPSNLTTPARPFALIAWGIRMEFSVVVDDLVTSFIKDNALRGPEHIVSDGQFDKHLIEPAQIISTVDDAILCPKTTMNVAGLF